MKFLILIFLILFQSKIGFCTLNINLSPEESIEFKDLFKDKEVLTVSPEDSNPYAEEKKNNKLSEESNIYDNNPNLKEVINDISENGRFLTPETEEDRRNNPYQTNNYEFKRKMEEKVENTMDEIHEEAEAENLKEKENEERRKEEFAGFEKNRFLQKNNQLNLSPMELSGLNPDFLGME